MNGVTIPGVSAGSNHVGASETCTPQVTWPSGAAPAGIAATAEISRTRTVTDRRGLIVSLQQGESMGDGTIYGRFQDASNALLSLTIQKLSIGRVSPR